MKIFKRFRRPLLHMVWIGCLSSLSMVAIAEVRALTAVFRPDPNHPQQNTFTNTTPNQGFCLSYPDICTANNMFSVRIPNIFKTKHGPIQPDHTDPRAGAMIKAPADWRELTVRNAVTNEVETLEVRIAGVGGVYDLSDSVMDLTGEPNLMEGHRALWEGSDWSSAQSPCRAIGPLSYYGSMGFQFFWLMPTPTICAKKAKYLIPGLGYRYVDISYELRTPNPLGMSTGAYVGSTVYTVGPSSDLDFGDILLPDDNILQLDFTLTVEHTLKIDIPPGGNTVELVPQGGWQSWLQNGRKPTRLFRDQTFNISTSSRFKMQMECQYSQDGNTCSLYEPVSGHAVPLNISVSLPHGLTDAGGQAVNRLPLSRIEDQVFQPGFYVDRKPGTLHFEITPNVVDDMVQPGQTRHYSGNVTVIWDSEV
ncbi:hypothetical protein [Pseudomonas sp. TH41]